MQIARARVRQWTSRTEARFLATLAATCNVKAACAEAGLSVPSAYKHRDRWAGFAKGWDEALATGCIALEAALLEAGANFFSAREAAPPDAGDPSPPAIAAMDAHQALHLLYMHKHYRPRPGRLPGRPPTRAPEEQVAAKIYRELARLKRRKAAARKRRLRLGLPAVS